MEKSAVFIYAVIYLALQLQLVLAAYSNACNSSALILENKELGLRGGRLPDNHFQASSYPDPTPEGEHTPWRGRLEQEASGNQASCWCSKFKDKNQWLWINLAELCEVNEIATQGQYDPVNSTRNFTTSWVTKYTIEYSSDNQSFFSINYKYERPLIFKGNSDGNSKVCNKLPYTIKTQYIRVRPVAWNTSICLRVGLFGTRVGGNVSEAFFNPTIRPDHETWWWWIFFWAIMAFLLLIAFLGLLIYCCIIRRRTYSKEKVIKEKSVKAPIERKPGSYVNDAYDMTVMTNKTSVRSTPQEVEDPGDEIQEVTAEFTADEQENQKGIVGFSVTDDTKNESDEETTANGDVNWDEYKERAMSKRSHHAYENVDLKNNP